MDQGKFDTLISRPLYNIGYILFLAEKVSGRLAILSSFIWLHWFIKIYLGTGKNNVRFTFPQNCTILRQVNNLMVLGQSGRSRKLNGPKGQNWTVQMGSKYLQLLFKSLHSDTNDHPAQLKTLLFLMDRPLSSLWIVHFDPVLEASICKPFK